MHATQLVAFDLEWTRSRDAIWLPESSELCGETRHFVEAAHGISQDESPLFLWWVNVAGIVGRAGTPSLHLIYALLSRHRRAAELVEPQATLVPGVGLTPKDRRLNPSNADRQRQLRGAPFFTARA